MTGTTAAVISGATSAVFTSLCSQAALSLANNNGDIGKAAKSLTTTESFKTIGIAMATGGLNKAVGPVVSRVAMGIATKQKPRDILVSIAIDRIAGNIANKIGQAKFDYLTHKIAHGALGGAMGFALGKDKDAAIGGAFAGVLAEVVAGAIEKDPETVGENVAKRLKGKEVITEQDLETAFAEETQSTVNWARLSAGVGALLAGYDVDISAAVATNAVMNNHSEALKAMASPQVLAMLSRLGYTGRLTAGALAFLQKYDELSDEAAAKFQAEMEAADEDADGDVLERSGSGSGSKSSAKSIPQTGSGSGGSALPPDWEPEDKERKSNCTKQESSVWKGFQNYRGEYKTDGDMLYKCDHLHNDIEVFSSRGDHIGSMDPVTGAIYKVSKGYKVKL